MKTRYVLIDYENVQVKSLALLHNENCHVRVFLGPTNKRMDTDLVLAMSNLGGRAGYIQLETSGANALDFHITYYLGQLAALDAEGSFYIISKDTGFDSLIKHVVSKGVFCQRSVSIEALPFIKKPDAIVKALVEPLPAIKVVQVTKPEPKPAIKAKAKVEPKKPEIKNNTAQLVERVLVDLKKKKGKEPRTEKTLMSTIKMLCGTKYSDKEVRAVFDDMLKQKFIVVDGLKITYSLSAPKAVSKKPVAKVKAKVKAEPKKSAAKKMKEDLADLVLANFDKRKSSAPRSVIKLKSTIKTLCGNQYSDKEIDAVYNYLIKQKYVVANGDVITYQIP